jgi:hypothetical protein
MSKKRRQQYSTSSDIIHWQGISKFDNHDNMFHWLGTASQVFVLVGTASQALELVGTASQVVVVSTSAMSRRST